MKLLLGCAFLLQLSSPFALAAYSGLGSESIDPAIVKSYAAPVLPKEITNPIQSFFDLRPQGAGVYDHSKKAMFFDWRITGTHQVWKIDKPYGQQIQLTGGAMDTHLVSVSPDGRYIILSRDSDGEENPGLYWQLAEGGPVHVIQHKPKVQTHFGFITDDNRFILYTANDIKADSYAIYRFDIKTNKSELIFSEDGNWVLADHSNNGELLLELEKGSQAREFFLYDPKTKIKTPLLGQNENESYEMHFAGQPAEYFVLTNKMTDFNKLYLWSQKKGFKEIPTFKPKETQWEIEGFAIDRVRQKLYAHINENGFTRVKALSAVNFKALDFPKFPDADHVAIRRISRDGRYVSITKSSASTPIENLVYDWKTKKLQSWLKASTPEVDPKTFPKAEQEYYLSRDNIKIPMLVRRPASCKDKLCPVIVKFHGGPEGQSRPGFNTAGQIFLDAGFVFVEPNVRGSIGYGKAWLDSDNGPKRLNVITDIEDCALFIRKNWQVHGVVPKIGITGYSYGGYSTLVAMSRFAGAYDAGVALVGMSNLVSFLENTAPYRRKLRISEYGDPKTDLEALKELSPIHHIDKIKSPLLVIQGVNDPRVPAGEALQIHQTLQSKKIPSSLILFADEGHGSKKRSNQVLELGHTVQFFKQHLVP